MRDVITELTEIKIETLTKLPYEQLSQWEVGKAVIKEAINHWMPLGFLDRITNERKKEMLAVAFDNVAHDLLTEDERIIKIEKRYNFNCATEDVNETEFSFETIVFPVLRKVVCGNKKTDGISNFNYKKFLDYLEDYSFLAINYDGYDRERDIEAEFCEVLSYMIKQRFDNEKNID